MDNSYIYITIPKAYKDIYISMLLASIDYGIVVVKDCNHKCNKFDVLTECFNLFNSVVAAYNLNQHEQAETIAEYIICKLKSIGIKVTEHDIPINPPIEPPVDNPELTYGYRTYQGEYKTILVKGTVTTTEYEFILSAADVVYFDITDINYTESPTLTLISEPLITELGQAFTKNGDKWTFASKMPFSANTKFKITFKKIQ